MFLFVVSSKLVKMAEYISIVKFAKGVRPRKLCPKLVRAEIQNCGLDHDGD